jgi:hypothetical protein
VDLKAVEPGRSGPVMGDVAGRRVGERHDPVARPGAGHKRVQVGEGAAADVELGVAHPHVVPGAGIAEAGPAADAGGQQRGDARVHHVGAGVEADTLAVHVLLVARKQLALLGL